MTDKTKVLVIGSTGMLGTKIVNALLAKGETEVRAMVRPGSYEKEKNRQPIDDLKAKGAIMVEGDLMKSESLLPICEGVDVLVSAVGNNAGTVPGQKNAINAAKKQGVKSCFESKISVITGASKGIGFATAQRLANMGYQVIGLARHAPQSAFPGEFVKVDFSDRAATAKVA